MNNSKAGNKHNHIIQMKDNAHKTIRQQHVKLREHNNQITTKYTHNDITHNT